MREVMMLITVITVMLVYFSCVRQSNGQLSCIETVNAIQRGDRSSPSNRQVIMPKNNFSCNGRITGYLISLERVGISGGYPRVQVWHPKSTTEYTRVETECALTENDIRRMTDNMKNEYYLGNVSCNGNKRIEFQSGDVLGYHQADPLHYRLWSIAVTRYITYHLDETVPLTTLNLYNADDIGTKMQPLIEVMYDIRCDDLSPLANGEIVSCSSGRVGVGYEGDTCSFTCNTGYELTGSDTRTCQSDGRWSGSDAVCKKGIFTTMMLDASITTTVTSISPPTVTSNVPDNTDSSSDNAAIIGGAVGGAVGGVILLSMITAVLCIVIVCMRRSHRKEDNEVAYSTTTDIAIANSTTTDPANHIYSTIKPIYSNVPITINPSYNAANFSSSKMSSGYVQPNVYIQANPPYRVSMGDSRATDFSNAVINSDTRVHPSSFNVTANRVRDSADQSHNTRVTRSHYLTLIANCVKPTSEDVIN